MPRKSLAVCGTNAGYQAHIRHHEPTCKPCRDATAEYMREYRARTGRVRFRLVPIERAGKRVRA